MPKSRLEFWKPKLAGNVARDGRNHAKLIDAGWRVLVIWECETKNGELLSQFKNEIVGDNI